MSRRTARSGQLALGLLWLIDGALQFQPYMFGRSFVTGVLLPSAAGQPGFVGAPVTWIAHQIEPHVAPFNAFAATLEVLIGLGLLYRRTVKAALVASFAWALGIWVAGEGLGMLLTGNATPLTGAPGAALLYLLAGLMCWPGSQAAKAVEHGELGLLGERGARLAWGALWLGYAALWLLPANSSAGAAHDAIAGAPSGASWLSSVLDTVAAATSGRGTAIAVSMAVACGAIGLAVVCGWHARAFLTLAIALSLSYWLLGQGLGGVLTGEATDVGTAPLVILIASMLMSAGHASSVARRAARSGEPNTTRLRVAT